jgi:hypothetical protein
MQYGVHTPTIISDPSKGRQSEKKVMDGIIHSAMLTPFQRTAMDGIVSSAMPGGKETKPKSEVVLEKVKPGKTKQTIGARHFPGSSFA